jgi:bifunctional DNA-binding transcriptional regulator/antitoxin component of YhaV-PrlF toxin-antitoxin module
MSKATVKIPKDVKHRIVLPKEIWELEQLQDGDFIEIDIRKIDRTKVTI